MWEVGRETEGGRRVVGGSLYLFSAWEAMAGTASVRHWGWRGCWPWSITKPRPQFQASRR